jgi:hypothetical protein
MSSMGIAELRKHKMPDVDYSLKEINVLTE